jgi:hypothetical protein
VRLRRILVLTSVVLPLYASPRIEHLAQVANQPVVSEISPTRGLVSGGTRVSITCSDLTTVSAVHFGSVLASSFEQLGSSLIIAISPAGTGTVDVTVTTSNGTSSTGPEDEFTYIEPPPVVRSIDPTRGATSGETPVTITGGNFENVTAVDFGATAALGMNVDSKHQITATSPAGTGTVDVTVTTNSGTSAITPKDQFSYGFPTPSVSSVKPAKGDSLGGTRVAIVGANLEGATSVDFGTTAAVGLKVNSERSITATSPAGSGTVDVTVSTPYGVSTITPSATFTYVVHPPFVSSVLPNSGSTEGGTAVTISGENFKDATKVTFGSVPARSFEIDSDTSISASSPSGAGTVDITITTPQGTSSLNSSDQFTYG